MNMNSIEMQSPQRGSRGGGQPVLDVVGLTARYGSVSALDEVSLQVYPGELVALVGSNGAGKSTLLRTVSGLQPAAAGEIRYQGRALDKMKPPLRVREGIAHVPEGRRVFAPMSVEDNLSLGAYTRGDGNEGVGKDLEDVYEMFPILREKRSLLAGTLSGGQQQMLAIGRALMSRPQLLLLDEPSMGLAPLLIAEVFKVVERLKEKGMTILIVEQNATAALELADYGYVLEAGRVTKDGEGHALCHDEDVRRAYLGI